MDAGEAVFDTRWLIISARRGRSDPGGGTSRYTFWETANIAENTSSWSDQSRKFLSEPTNQSSLRDPGETPQDVAQRINRRPQPPPRERSKNDRSRLSSCLSP
jgi:hypothetical protein